MRIIVKLRRIHVLGEHHGSALRARSIMMSSNRHKTVMCYVCGIVMRDDNLKCHMITKHGSAVSDGERRKSHQLQSQATFATNEPDDGQSGKDHHLQRQATFETWRMSTKIDRLRATRRDRSLQSTRSGDSGDYHLR